MTARRGPTTLISTLSDRIFPRGAIVLSVLSLAYFAMGIIRNRVFAGTYGAGAELDAYNAAFRIPEIALDVLAAAGLTAPFVPIYRSLRHDRGDEPANDFGRTVLTGAFSIMAVASAGLFVAAPWLGGIVGAGFDAPARLHRRNDRQGRPARTPAGAAASPARGHCAGVTAIVGTTAMKSPSRSG